MKKIALLLACLLLFAGCGSKQAVQSLTDIADSAVSAMAQKDTAALSKMIHPEKGLTFTPYSTVDTEENRCISAEAFADFFADDNLYSWGRYDGSGDTISMTNGQYWERYVWNTDYTKAPDISENAIVQGGNSTENLTEVYPDAVFVDYHYSEIDPQYDGIDWCSLKLVFEEYNGELKLVAIVHGEWTV